MLYQYIPTPQVWVPPISYNHLSSHNNHQGRSMASLRCHPSHSIPFHSIPSHTPNHPNPNPNPLPNPRKVDLQGLHDSTKIPQKGPFPISRPPRQDRFQQACNHSPQHDDHALGHWYSGCLPSFHFGINSESGIVLRISAP